MWGREVQEIIGQFAGITEKVMKSIQRYLAMKYWKKGMLLDTKQ